MKVKRIFSIVLNYVNLLTLMKDIETEDVFELKDSYIQTVNIFIIWVWYFLLILICRGGAEVLYYFTNFNPINIIYSLVFIFILFIDYISYTDNLAFKKPGTHFSLILRSSTRMLILLIFDKSIILLINSIF